MHGPLPVGVIGLGLIGGSVALAYREAGHPVFGFDRDAGTLQAARAAGIAVDRDWTRWVDDVAYLFVATPLPTVPQWIKTVAETARAPKVVAELSSVKRPVIPALETLPNHLTPLALHPMAGKERSGFAAADPDLFRGARCAVVPVRGQDGIGVAEPVLKTLGMRPVVIDAAAHDWAVAVSSHLPYLVAAVLLTAAAESEAEWRELVGPGFLDTTRAGAAPWEIFEPILRANRDAVQAAAARFRRRLDEVLDRLERDLALDPLRGAASVRARLTGPELSDEG
ncbi:MAG: prephenate dehydrogenase/arogenate dehydrogenase family protein [Firmicutes bacterium]|nr:prephenate dehydrogenase/arogenate dehydrogenase family protein [Alicyclobacillaceae bacterium]MCL6496409.1 prephenate dehydrogenase/arogenate dehydrogenase family protein [Bacillota bacterium]